MWYDVVWCGAGVGIYKAVMGRGLDIPGAATLFLISSRVGVASGETASGRHGGHDRQRRIHSMPATDGIYMA